MLTGRAVGARDAPASEQALPCDYCPNAGPLTARLVAMDARLDRIEVALFGDAKKAGLIEHVETLVDITKIGRSTIRVFLWFGAAVVAVATASWQVKQAIVGLFH